MIIKALSLWQPWASALFTGLKIHETRGWAAPRWVIGQRIAIHAAKRDTADEIDFWESNSQVQRDAFAAIGIHSYAELPRGCIIGTVEIVACHRTEDVCNRITTTDWEWGNYQPGRFAWQCRNPVLLAKPVPCVGRQLLFNWQVPAGMFAGEQFESIRGARAVPVQAACTPQERALGAGAQAPAANLS